MDIKEVNSAKKSYLRGYFQHSKRAKKIEAELEEVRNMKCNPSMNNDGMPRGSSQTDLSSYVAEVCDLEEKLYSEGVEQVKAYKDIQKKIREVEDENERDVLFYRYIKGKKFWEISQILGYSERQINRIHGNALAHFKLSKDVIACHNKKC